MKRIQKSQIEFWNRLNIFFADRSLLDSDWDSNINYRDLWDYASKPDPHEEPIFAPMKNERF